MIGYVIVVVLNLPSILLTLVLERLLPFLGHNTAEKLSLVAQYVLYGVVSFVFIRGLVLKRKSQRSANGSPFNN